MEWVHSIGITGLNIQEIGKMINRRNLNANFFQMIKQFQIDDERMMSMQLQTQFTFYNTPIENYVS